MTIISDISFDLSRVDGNAFTIFIIGFGVVFAALLIIYLIFSALSKILKINIKKSNSGAKSNVSATEVKTDVNSEIYAAIAMALSLHFEDTHDEESMVLTINLNDRLNSQWSSKIQNVNLHNN